MLVESEKPARLRDRLPRVATLDALEGAVLVLALAVLALLFVAAHRSSIWSDREFTGGIAPLANRLVHGQRLYADGMHSPLPPLSFVLIRVISGGDATWLLGNALNYLFQALTLIVSWLFLRRTFDPRVAFLATLCAIPVFLSLPKAVFYDALVEFLVALAALIVVAWPRRAPLLLGVVTGLALMTKQSVGLGLVAAIAIVLVAAPVGARAFSRSAWRSLALYAGSLAATFLVLLGAFAPWADPGGLIHDVVVTGSEPKGEFHDIVHKVGAWSRDVGRAAAAIGLGFGLLLLAARRLNLPRERYPWRRGATTGFGRPVVLAIAAATLAGAAVGALAWTLHSHRLDDPLHLVPDSMDPWVQRYRYILPLAALIVVALVALWVDRRRADERLQRFLRVFVVLLLPAVGMSLSSPALRWWYDNNPLVAFGLAVLVAAILWVASLIPKPALRVAAAAGPMLLAGVLLWASLGDQVRIARAAKVAWPEVSHLDGALMRPESSGMRTLVGVVRSVAGPHETALLLPEDPNVGAWFERPRPRLTSAMVFTDQYWDRYVDEDFRRLAAHPPKVIVIGPRNLWRPFSHIVHTGWGAERLIDRVRTELIPRRYRPLRSLFIRYSPVPVPGGDWMDVWVLRSRTR